jgi:type I restriction enzyme S subunit
LFDRPHPNLPPVGEGAEEAVLKQIWAKDVSLQEWKFLRLADVIEDKPKNGYSAKPVSYETGWRVLTLTATTSGYFDNRHFKHFDEPIPDESPFWCRPGDILVQRGNTIEYVGVSAVFTGEHKKFIFPDLMMRVRAGSSIKTEFLYFSLSCESTRQYMRNRATGTAGNMPKINQQILLDVPVLVPTLEEQTEIVRRVKALFALADRIEARYKAAAEKVDKLTPALLAKAFRGELVPQDPNDEPAAVLLERIRAQRVATPLAKTGRGKKARVAALTD